MYEDDVVARPPSTLSKCARNVNSEEEETSGCGTAAGSPRLLTAEDDRFVVGSKQLRSSLKKEGSSKDRKAAKSVSFHSASSTPNERKIVTATECIHYMISGSSLIKIKSNIRHYHRFFSINDDITALRWVPSTKKSKNAQLPIDSIREIRTGKTTDVLRNKEVSGNLNDDCCFSIIHGESFYSLDLVASSPEEANIWVTGLNALITMSKSREGLEERQSIRDRWLKEMFEEADISSSGCLDKDEAIALIRKLNNHVNAGRVHKKIMEFDHNKTSDSRGRIDSGEFIDMFKEISTRPEIYFLMIRYACKDYLTLEDLQLFLEGEQGMMDLNAYKCRQIILEHEPASEARLCDQLLIDGFNSYLQSKQCDIFDPTHNEVCQDMSQPLTHYFISSSHNTYLLEDQLKGPSSVDGFIKALHRGCRCVKVEVWDGNTDPVVYHGNTLTSRIPFKDVILSIKDNAFVASRYPVIIHLESHCSISSQQKMAKILKNVLGPILFVPSSNTEPSIHELTPENLKGKILISGKKLMNDDLEGFVTDEDEDRDKPANLLLKDNEKNYKLCKKLSDLVCIMRTSFLDLKSSKGRESIYESFSIKESCAARMSHIFADEFVNNNKHYLTRVHPNGCRIDSSNFNPQDFWNCGCQMVAMNFQTQGLMMDLHEGRFKQNGSCGYVLKPSVMTEPISYFSAHSKDVIPGISPQVLRVKIISAQQLPRPTGTTAKGDGIDPYVTVQIFGIPADCFESRTKTVSNQGNCPVFEESFEFNINLPDLALVRFVVLDDEYIGDDFIGQYTVPLDCIRPGYRHVQLYSSSRQMLVNSTLFVHISITNKRGGGKKNIKKSSRKRRITLEMRPTLIKTIDESFKASEPFLAESFRIRVELDRAMADLRTECGLPETSNIKQCLRVIITRLSSSMDVTSVKLADEHGFPTLKAEGSLNAYLCKLIFLFEKVIMEYRFVLGNSDKLIDALTRSSEEILSFHENINYLCIESGLKGKKYNKALENFAWNVTVLRGQLDLMQAYKKDCTQSLDQVKNSAPTIENMVEKERSPTQRPTIKVNNNSLSSQSKFMKRPCSPTLLVVKDDHKQQLHPVESKSSSQPSINDGSDIKSSAKSGALKPHQTLTSTVSCPLQSTKSEEAWI